MNTPRNFAALGTKLARLARVVDGVTGRQDLGRFVFEVRQRLVERGSPRLHALDAHGVELLEALELARFGGRLEGGEGRQGTSFPFGPEM